MQERFEYEARETCICGERLAPNAGTVTKSFARGEVRFLRCSACGSWCQSPMIAPKAIARWFESEDYTGSARGPGIGYADYAADELNRVAEARGRYERDLAPLLKPRSKVLEVGCATGSLLSVLREHGHTVSGVDVSSNFVRAAKSLHGLEVQLGDFMDIRLPAHPYDAVLAMGTVSNLHDLPRALARVRELLAPGGFIVFNFPDADSAWVRLLYRERFWMFTPSVRTFMTTRGCAAALSRAGFRSVVISADRQRPSLRKLLHHGRAGMALRALSRVGLANARAPFAFPVPSVRLVVAS
jgi:SAM-dependent methyltransferase